MSKIKLDLHDIFNKGDMIEKELYRVVKEASEKGIPLVEIIPGKGSGTLKKKVIKFLQQPDIKEMYHRYDIDNKNFGRIFVHFKK